MKRAVAVVAFAVALAGCGGGPDHGKVVSKDHEDARDYFTTQCITIGKNPCGSTILIPRHEDEKWLLTLRDCEERDGCDEGEVDVPHNVWARYNVGDYYGPQS